MFMLLLHPKDFALKFLVLRITVFQVDFESDGKTAFSAVLEGQFLEWETPAPL